MKFHPDLRKSDLIHMLQQRFQHLPPAEPKTVSDIDNSLDTLPTRGQPIKGDAIKLFRCADIIVQNGATLEAAIVSAMETFPDVKPRQRRPRKITTKTIRDPDHDKLILLAEYKRYRAIIESGLNPAVAYSRNNFFEYILTRQWETAAAIFTKANKERRKILSDALNAIGNKNIE